MKTQTAHPRRQGRKRPVVVAPKSNGFFNCKSLEEVVRERGLMPFDPAAFAKSFEGIVPPQEDMQAFVEEIYKART